MKEKFIQFLKDNGALEKFKDNCDFPFAKYLKNHLNCGIISHAFSWDNSEEGWRYWNDIDNKWRRICKSN